MQRARAHRLLFARESLVKVHWRSASSRAPGVGTPPAFATRVAHGAKVSAAVDPVAPPIHLSSTFVLDTAEAGAFLSHNVSSFQDPPDGMSPWLYSRWANPTVEAAASALADLEGGAGCVLTSSGMAAVSSVLFSLVEAGTHIVMQSPVYGGTATLSATLLKRLGVAVTAVQGCDANAFAAAIRPNTAAVYIETPANPTMLVVDIREVAKRCRGPHLIVDSTFATPFAQRPLELGADIVIHSATKFLAGHSDVTAGAVVAAERAVADQVRQTAVLLGGRLAPFDAYLLQRGMKTLDVRMERHCASAFKIALALEKHARVTRVHYPGLASHPGHKTAVCQMGGKFGGMLSFEVDGGFDAARRVVESCRVATHAVSLGGVETLIIHPASTTHAMVPRDVREAGGITDGMLRLSVGLEDPNDLADDLAAALDSM